MVSLVLPILVGVFEEAFEAAAALVVARPAENLELSFSALLPVDRQLYYSVPGFLPPMER